MRTGILLAGLLASAALAALATPAAATCVQYDSDSRVCATANAGTPTVDNDGRICVDRLCPDVDMGTYFCVYWVSNGQVILWTQC